MLRNIICRDRTYEIILSAYNAVDSKSVLVNVYRGHAQGARVQAAFLSCDLSNTICKALLDKVMSLCWHAVREYGSVTNEVEISVDAAVAKKLMSGDFAMREIDWTKQIPTELGSGDTA